jgi:glycosyltransferase involved in cell wall biosynthesis
VRIAQVAPVATTIPPSKSGSVEQVTAALTDALAARGHEVTLFATGGSTTRAALHATFAHGYWHDAEMWPWELYEMMNLAAAVERADAFDVIHYQAAYYPISLAFAGLSPTPIVTTVHHTPGAGELALWSRRPEAPFIAISDWQARQLAGVTVAAAVHHGIDLEPYAFRETPDDYLLFLGRFTEGKGVLAAIAVARSIGMRLLLAGPRDDYYDHAVAPHVDGVAVVYVGEVDVAGKVALCGGARALLYPVQSPEPFGLVLVEAMACGTPIAALDCGAAREVIGVHGGLTFGSIADLGKGLPRVLSLDRGAVRCDAVARFSAARMAAGHERVYEQLAIRRQPPQPGDKRTPLP